MRIAAMLLCAAAAARADWIDRVQPECAMPRVLANRELEELQLHEMLAKGAKDEAEKKRLLDRAAELRPSAEKRQREYEKCRETAPRQMSEEQARREEEEAQQQDLQRMIERQNHPPGAIAPMPRREDPPPPPPPPPPRDVEKERVLHDPAKMKLVKTAWACWNVHYSEFLDETTAEGERRLREVGCLRPRVKQLRECMERFWARGEKFAPGDPCLRPLERTTVEEAP